MTTVSGWVTPSDGVSTWTAFWLRRCFPVPVVSRSGTRGPRCPTYPLRVWGFLRTFCLTPRTRVDVKEVARRLVFEHRVSSQRVRSVEPTGGTLPSVPALVPQGSRRNGLHATPGKESRGSLGAVPSTGSPGRLGQTPDRVSRPRSGPRCRGGSSPGV